MFYRRDNDLSLEAVSLKAFSILLAGICLSGAACKSRLDSKPRIVFIPPLANLSADPGLDWFGRALSRLIVARTTGSSSDVQTLDSTEANATHRLEGYFSDAGGVLHVRTAIRDLALQKIVGTSEIRGPATELFRMSETLGRNIAGNAAPYTTTSLDAVRHLFDAVESRSAGDVLRQIDSAISADPAYGAAHIARIEALLAMSKRDEAIGAASAAAAPGVRLTEEEKLRLAGARATLSGDVRERARATRELARLRPGDMQLWRTAAELALLEKDFPAAIEAFNHAARLEPDNIAVWNTLGYAHAFAGDLSAARKALEEYRRIAPDDANALDSLGEVHFYLGRFAEAEKYYLEAFDKNRALLGGGEAFRAAMARLMMGDRETADKHFATYLELRKQSGDVLAPIRQELWRFWTGRRAEAAKALEQVTAPAEAAVAARFVLSLWSVQFGDLNQARMWADRAVQLAKTPHPASLALVAKLLASPPGPINDLEALLASGDPARRQLLGYSLLLHRNYADASRVWTAVYNRASAVTSNDERILLAWAETERGNAAEAAKLMRAYSIPPPGADPGLPSILFPRSLYLKAMAEQHANNREEAQRLFKLFLSYSAGRDFVYGEERRAREALSQH